MNKIINIVKNILLFANVLIIGYMVLNYASFVYDFARDLNFFIYVLSTLMLVIFEIKKLKRKDPLVDDFKYNVMMLLTELMFLFIVYRNFYDPNLFMSVNEYGISTAGGIRSFFIINNFNYMNLMNIGLIAYYYINRIKKF